MALDVVYPAPRTQRTVRSAAPGPLGVVAGAAVVEPPRVRSLVFRLGQTQAGRATRSIGPFIAPAVVRNLRAASTVGSDPPKPALDLGYSLQPVTEDNVAVSTPLPFVSFHDPVARPVGDIPASEVQRGVYAWTVFQASAVTSGGYGAWPVPVGPFYVCLSIGSSDANSGIWVAYVEVVEALAPEEVANFL